jgi:hypothetical protein
VCSQVLLPAATDQPLPAGPVADEVAALLGCAVLASNASVHPDPHGAWVAQGDPTEAALGVADARLGDRRWPAGRHSRWTAPSGRACWPRWPRCRARPCAPWPWPAAT